MAGFLLSAGLFLCSQVALAGTYGATYQSGGIYVHNVSVPPGTHTFTVTGVPKGGIWPGTPGSYTDWYITDSGGSPVERDNSYVSDPAYNYGLNSGSYIVRAETYLGNGTWKEVHRWYATVTQPEMDVRGNGVSIADGDTTPSTGDYTDFGSTPVGTPVTKRFYVYNTGTAALTPGTITVPSGFTLVIGLISSIPAGSSDYFDVRLNATSAGTYSGDISIPNNDANENPYNFRITGTVTQPEIDVRGNGVSIADGDTTPSTSDYTDFGSTPVGTTVERTFYVYNTGTGPLIPGTITVPSGYTLTVNLIPSIPAGGSDWFRVRLNATSAGTFAGDISIPNNDSNENPYNFRITGTVTVPPAPEIDVRGNSVSIADGDTTPSTGDGTDFGSTSVGATIERTFYVYNTGTAPLIPGTITVPSGYTLTVNLISSIPAGGSDWFRVRLNATSAGTYAGDISIPNNDSNENPYNFRITGTVAAAPAPELLVVSVPSTLVLGDWATVTVQVRNNGGTASDGGISVSFPGLTAAGDTANVEDFGSTTGDTPGYREFPQGSSIANKSGSQITANCMLVELGDDNWTGSEVNTLTFRVKPKATGGFTVNIRSAMGANSIYVGTPTSGPTDQQGWWVQQRTITVTAPEPEMDVRGNSVSIADGDTTPSTGDGTDFGTTPVGTPVERSFYVYNTGTGPLTLGTPALPSGYTLTIGIASSIPVGGSDWFRVRVNATAVGTYSGDISISNNDSNENPYNFRITGIVQGLAPDSYEADDTPGTSKTITSGQTQTRNIHAAGNVDWVQFTVGGAGTSNLVIETDGVSGGDTQVWLFGPNNSSLQVSGGYNDDGYGTGGRYSRLACGVNGMPASLSPGTYHIKVTEYQNDGTITSYTLRATWSNIGTIPPDSYESDNTPTDAKVITNGQTQNRNIHAAGNVDWVRFTIGGVGTSNLVLATDGPIGDTQMWLYGPNNSSAQVLNGYSDDEGNGAFSRLACGVNGMPATLSPGTYYIKITEYQNDGTIGAYTLRATWMEGGGITADAYEADNTPTDAKVITNGQTQNRNIHAAGNVDWVRFTIGGAGTSNLVIATDGVSGGDTQIWLFGPNNSALQVSGGYNDDGFGTGGRYSRLACGVNGMPASLSPGTYYVKITEYQNDGTISSYTLRTTWTDIPIGGGIIADAYEADNTPTDAKVITSGQTQNRNIHLAGNVDWARFTVGTHGATNVVIETDGPSGDTQMWLYGPNNSAQQVQGGYSDDEGNGSFSRLATGQNSVPTNLLPGTYYIKITEYQNDGTIGAYTLRATWTDLTTPVLQPDAFEADNTPTDAKVITNGQTQNRNIHAPGNVDWIKFTVGGSGAQNVRIETDGPSGDTQMWLFGPASATTPVPGGFSDDDGNGSFSLLVSGQRNLPATLQPGTYFIKVQEYQNDGTIPAYTLRASWSELPVFQAVLNSNVQLTSGTIVAGQRARFAFDVTSTGDYVIQTMCGTLPDTMMALFGPDGRQIGDTDDDSGIMRASKIVARSLTPGRYTVEVWGYQSSAGNFSIWIRCPAGASMWDQLFAASLGSLLDLPGAENEGKKKQLVVEANVDIGEAVTVATWGIVSVDAGPGASLSCLFDIHDMARRTDDGIEDYITLWSRVGVTLFSLGVDLGPVSGCISETPALGSVNADPHMPFDGAWFSWSVPFVPNTDGGLTTVPFNSLGVDFLSGSWEICRTDVPKELLDYVSRYGSGSTAKASNFLEYWSRPGTTHYGRLQALFSMALDYLPRPAETVGGGQ